MIFFGLMGLAALVIDMGFARLAQRQMQTAVDSAALEGLRWRDEFLLGTRQSPMMHGRACPQIASARQSQVGSTSRGQPGFNTWTPDGGEPMNFGAGPVVQFQGGLRTLPSASQQLIVPAPPVYQPTRSDGTPGLELNFGNASDGDMVAGTYALNGSYDAEPRRRTRTHNMTGGTFSPATTAASATAPGFLVRMRRTNDVNSLDHEPSASSGGPTLPFLFGRGSLMARSGDSGQLSVTSGTTVRATAIAAAGDGIQFGGSSYSGPRKPRASRIGTPIPPAATRSACRALPPSP